MLVVVLVLVRPLTAQIIGAGLGGPLSSTGAVQHQGVKLGALRQAHVRCREKLIRVNP